MDSQRIQLLVPGRQVTAEPDADIRHLLKVEPISSNQIQTASRGEAAQQTVVEGPGDSIVKLEYESGLVEWLRLDQFQAELGPSRAEGPTPVPALLNRSGSASRGAADWALKAMHVFGISPVDKIAEGSAALIVSGLEDKLSTGLFRLKPDGSFGEKITAELPADPQTYLVFIHGTASSTQGSFHGFWDDPMKKEPTDEWKALLKTYGNRILALEHRTLSVSPAQNTLDLVKLLPPKATVHVITHSRGGLVGELLGLKSLSEDDLKGFAGRPDQQLFNELVAEIARKEINVSKFVRTACPAGGTILASKRIDLYLNIILNAIGLIPGLAENPGYAVFKAAALQLIKLRADPALLPGLEAQMPESPVIHLLNTQGRFSDADLGVIAGDFQGGGVWGTLKEYSLRAYYLEDNDFVVNTKSMSGGMERKKGVWRFLDQGSTVNHFSYFKNARTREQILNWLAGAPAVATDFQRVRGVEPAGAARGATRGTEQMPVAFLVPDLFGTYLVDKTGTEVWPEFDALAKGRFLELAGDSLLPGLIHESYRPLFDGLNLSYDTVPVPYDWRLSVKESAAVLERTVSDKLAGQKREVIFIAHGMGGLLVWEFASRDDAIWRKLCGENGGLLMLGTPMFGSWHIMRLLAGRSRLVRMIALLGRHRDSEVVSVLQGFDGLLDLLPKKMYDLAAWHGVPLTPPAENLQVADAWRESIRYFRPCAGRNFYVAGIAPATPSSMDDYTTEGDGVTTHALGKPPSASVWYSASDHGGLVAQVVPIIQLLDKGASKSLESEPYPSVSVLNPKAIELREEAVFFPGEGEFLNAVFGRHDQSAALNNAVTEVIEVKVVHGHLREARHPLAVGHYAGDGIVSAEAELDRQLGGILSDRFHLEIYPGSAGTAEVVLAPRAHPPGALVVGLGDVGEITPNKLFRTMVDACVRYALMRSEESSDLKDLPRSAAISSLLIGISGGRAISVADSMKSIVLAAVEANRVLRRRKLSDRVRIDEVEFIELYEHLAIRAAHAAATLQQTLKNELLPNERINFEGQIRPAKGGLFRPPEDEYVTGWWRRIQISKERYASGSRENSRGQQTASSLVFENLTDRARAEESGVLIQVGLLDSLLAQATSRPSSEESGPVALFELLLPNAMKESNDQADLVLVLDAAAAAFPWEILAARTGDHIDPLSVRAGMIRQLKVDRFRVGPRGAKDQNALVIGDTLTDAASGLPELPGAQREAREVTEQLTKNGYRAEPLIRQPSLDVIRQLFARDYRIMHLAGHGIYNPEYPEKSGMVLGPNQFLTSLELGQVRNLPEFVFINCCYLAKIDAPQWLDSPHKQAASIAQVLIEMGVKAVVAAGWAVNDAAGLVFARSFYQSMLGGGLKFGEAVKRARQDTYALGNNNTWGAYQCYGNPDFALMPQAGTQGRPKRVFYSRRECVDELRDVAAQSTGAPAERMKSMAPWVGELDRMLISDWRDGESLSALAEAYKCLQNFDASLEAYDEALRDGKARASVQTIEGRANLQDRYAVKLFKQDPDRATKLWEDAERRLTGLNEVLGNSSERLSLLGAICKRRGKATADPTYFQKAAEFYQNAYKHTKATESRIDLYSGLNAVALAYVVNAESEIAEECLKFAAGQKDYPDFWARVYLPDALLLGHLRAGDLDGHVGEVIKAYQDAFQHGTPHERDSALGQLHFLIDAGPAEDVAALQRVLDGVS